MSKFEDSVTLCVVLVCGTAWSATPVALFTGETLKDGTVNGITLDLNGNSAADGVVTIVDKPVLASGLSGTDVSVIVKYTGPITATEYALVSAQSSGYNDVSGIWTDGTQLHGLWANNPWTASDAVHKDGTIPSSAEKAHRFCFTYGSGRGTYLYLDGKEAYAASGLKGGGLNPVGLAIGGMRGSAKGAAAGLVISEIAVYNEKVDGSASVPPANEVDDADCFGVFTASAEGLDKKISQEAVPSLGGAVLRVKNAASLPAGAYTLVEWTGLMGQCNQGYGQPTLDLCGADEANIRLIPMVGKVVLLKTDPAQLTQKPYKIWCVGDSITEGYNSSGNCANYRIQLATKLAVAGYNVQFVGQYTHRSKYASGAWAPDEWSWHSGVSGQRMWTRGSVGPNRLAGYVEAIDAAMYQVPNTDIICFLLGTNDFGAGESGEVVFNGWKIIVKKLLERYPNATIVVSPCIDMHDSGKNNRGAVFKTKIEAALAGTDDTFTAKERARLVNAQLDTYVTGSGVPYFEDGYHPTWDGHSKMSDGWYDAIVNNDLVSKTVEPSVDIDRSSALRGAEQNVDESYRDGFTKVRTLAIPEEVAYALNATPAYTEDAEAPARITKVAYYMELVRKDSGEVRYVWADMDAFGDTLEEMLVPTGANVQQKVTRLHVASNMGSITPVAADVNNAEGYLEFSPYTAAPAAVDGAPTALWSAMDWNDTLGTEGAGRGSMQVSRLKSDGYNAAELLFAWNNWGAGNTGADGTKAGEIGIGDFPQHYMADHSAGNGIASLINAKYPGAGVALNDTFVSSDYTTTRFSPWGDTMNAKAYSVRTLEIWVSEAGDNVIYIPAGETREFTSDADLTKLVEGEGRLVLNGFLPTNADTLASLRNAAKWTGTVEIKNFTKSDNAGIIYFQNYANANSTVALNGVNATMYSGANGHQDQTFGTLEIMAAGWTTGDGRFSGNNPLYNCNLTGSGPITISHLGGGTVNFCGDHTGFTGTINFASNAEKGVVLSPAGTGRTASGVSNRQVMIHANTTTSLTGSTNGTVIGAGTLVADGAMPAAALQTSLKANTWTGTLWLKNLTTKANYSATLLGNAQSTVRYTNVSGWFETAMKFDGTVDIVNDETGNGLTINDGSSGWADNRVVRFGRLTGAGTLNLAWAKTYPIHLKDVRGFTGAITCGSASGIGVLIGDSVTIDSAVSGAGKIQILEGADVTVATGATWTAPNGFVVNGSLATGKNQLKANANTLGAVSGSGTLKLSGASTADNPRVTAFVSSLANFAGTLHLAAGRIECQANEVPATVTVKVTDGAQFYAGGATTTWENRFVISGNGWTGEARYGDLSRSAMRMEHDLGPDAVVETVVENDVVPRISAYNGNKTYNATFTGPGVKLLCYNGSNTVTADPAKLTGLTGEITLTNVTLELNQDDASDMSVVLPAIKGGTVKKTGAGYLGLAADTTAAIKVAGMGVFSSSTSALDVTVADGIADKTIQTLVSGDKKFYYLADNVTEVTFTIGAAPEHAMVAILVGEDILEVEDGQYTAAVGSSFAVVYIPAPGYAGDIVRVPVTVTANMASTTIATPDMTITRPTGIGEEGERATKYDTWVSGQDPLKVVDAASEQLIEAFVLNVEPTAEAIADGKANFKLTISLDGNGDPVVNPAAGVTLNVEPVIKGKSELSDAAWVEMDEGNRQGLRFFKAFIDL